MTWLGIFILFSFNKIISEKKCKSFFCVITNWLHFFFFTSNFFCELQLCTQVLIYQKNQKKNAFVIFIVKNFVCCFGNPWLIVLNKLSLFEGENHYFLSPLNFHLLYLKMSFMTEVNKLSNKKISFCYWSKYWFVYAKKDGKSCQINYVTFLQQTYTELFRSSFSICFRVSRWLHFIGRKPSKWRS